MNRRIRWSLAAGLVAAAVAVVALDFRLTTPGRAMFCPPEAEWIAVASDFPSVYAKFENSPLGEALNTGLPDLRSQWQLAVRLDTGIRPTPTRWRVWLGREFLAAVSRDGRGGSFRPGVLLRAADAARGMGRWRPAVRRFGPYYYAWRDGAVIFSRSEKFVQASLDAEPFVYKPSQRAVWVFETRDARSAIGIRPDGDVEFTGWLEKRVSARGGLTRRCQLLPEDAAIAWVAAADTRNLRAIRSAVWDLLERHAGLSESQWFEPAADLIEHAARPWALDLLPADWDSEVAACLVALLDIDVSETLPVPEVGAIFAARQQPLGPHPLEPLKAGGPAFSYEWDGQSGIVAPRAGEKASLCLASSGSSWLAASQEPAMSRLIRALAEPRFNFKREIGSIAVGEIDWGKAADRAETVGRQAARLELLPRVDAAHFDGAIAPLLRELARLGHAQFEFFAAEDGERLEFSGTLTRGTGL